MSGDADAATETEDSGLDEKDARFFVHLPAHGLLPGLGRFRATTGQAPMFAVETDQDDAAVRGDADRRCAVGCAIGRGPGRVTRGDPDLAIRANGDFFAVLNGMVSQVHGALPNSHCHSLHRSIAKVGARSTLFG